MIRFAVRPAMRPWCRALLLVAFVARPAWACVWFPWDFFSPLPPCPIHDNANRAQSETGAGLSTVRVTAFLARVGDVRREVEQWSQMSTRAQAFKTRIDQWVGTDLQALDPLPAFVAEYNRRKDSGMQYILESETNLYRRWSIDGLSPDSVLALARQRLARRDVFDSVFRLPADMRAIGYGRSARNVMDAMGLTLLDRADSVQQQAEQIRRYGERVSQDVAGITNRSGQAKADLVTFAARLARAQGDRARMAQQGQTLRVDLLRAYQALRADASDAQARKHGWAILP
ncbi:MAG: hypothetical protein ACYC5V_01590 [Gemmatimonadaceae bacterium]